MSSRQPLSPTTGDEFALLVDTVEDYAIFLLGPDGEVRTWNRGAARIFGYAAEVLKRRMEAVAPDRDHRAHLGADLANSAACSLTMRISSQKSACSCCLVVAVFSKSAFSAPAATPGDDVATRLQALKGLFERGLITPALFSIMVFMAVVTTLMATPMFNRLYRSPVA